MIARGDTMANLVRRLLIRRPWRALVAAPLLPLWIALSASTTLRGRVSRALVRISCGGLSETEYQAEATDHGKRLASQQRWVIEAGVAQVRREQQHKKVIVTTGTELTLARAFLDAVGLQDVELCASELEFTRTSARYRVHNYGKRKVTVLETVGWELHHSHLYTDSIADLALAQRARWTILVNPSRRDRRHYRRVVARLSVVAW